MVTTLFICEGGLALIDDQDNPIFTIKFKDFNEYGRLLSASNVEELDRVLEYVTQNQLGTLFNPWIEIQPLLQASYPDVHLDTERRGKFELAKPELMVSFGLADDLESAQNLIRDYAIYKSNLRIKEESARPDLQAIECVQALDEMDKTFNLLYMRVREWYGLHFPELDQFIDDPKSFTTFVNTFKDRRDIDEDRLKDYGFSKQKMEALMEIATKSRGTELREEDTQLVQGISTLALDSYKLRDRLSKHLEENMKTIAPNVSELLGPVIGARIMAKAGSLERLARLPSSTIQILGAEKALYRAIKSGGRPPKHGLIFQHKLVHDAPKWQRGKMARALASKVALGARIDYFSRRLDKRLMEDLEKKVEIIKKKYDRPRIKEGHGKHKDKGRRWRR
ncbi:MAG: C/D box methylation guide ribonucleoprotein complex aNOP56 subunit [Nitrososphaerota archaeon]|jgi:nucleolar protein 56|nr:C/D box methylation guide ribonucleoprotein complex aNOP56 subunit [Nitrososphaerota archaeon]MDG7037592.1 C/D box methylation guide ribonucleoprotein complex aNOP56 subunit [Nitrososphaerota archaeon]MDG7039725.1 C/D box methylation guide ribonucleoprotein complex aNOP56 subunit [Nitrososphaerota archaeon]MDG7045339.1 C/D box methylation guide ribonucleoprotein complex aNOP56 subunit [Nitrososphaerota archaeon]MDG7045962.1 C/D box methylation guide ribonucleoprotein complex aNOP56 subunit [